LRAGQDQDQKIRHEGTKSTKKKAKTTTGFVRFSLLRVLRVFVVNLFACRRFFQDNLMDQHRCRGAFG
jgi:hypothetical protein